MKPAATVEEVDTAGAAVTLGSSGKPIGTVGVGAGDSVESVGKPVVLSVLGLVTVSVSVMYW